MGECPGEFLPPGSRSFPDCTDGSPGSVPHILERIGQELFKGFQYAMIAQSSKNHGGPDPDFAVPVPETGDQTGDCRAVSTFPQGSNCSGAVHGDRVGKGPDQVRDTGGIIDAPQCYQCIEPHQRVCIAKRLAKMRYRGRVPGLSQFRYCKPAVFDKGVVDLCPQPGNVGHWEDRVSARTRTRTHRQR